MYAVLVKGALGAGGVWELANLALGAVVADKNDVGVLPQPVRVEPSEQPTNFGIHSLYHGLMVLVAVLGDVLLGARQPRYRMQGGRGQVDGGVGRVERLPEKKGFGRVEGSQPINRIVHQLGGGIIGDGDGCGAVHDFLPVVVMLSYGFGQTLIIEALSKYLKS